MHLSCWIDPLRFMSQEPVEVLSDRWNKTCLHVQRDIRAFPSKNRGVARDAVLACLFDDEYNAVKLSREENKCARRRKALQRTAQNEQRKAKKRTRSRKERDHLKNPDNNLP